MNNADAPFTSAPMELFGGLYTEATPESLPLGASPRVINCDFILGSVLQRPGKQVAFYFANTFFENLTTFTASVPGSAAPNETPWTTPTNAELNVPGTYASVALNFAGGGGGGLAFFDNESANSGTASNNPNVTGSPSVPGEIAILFTEATEPGIGGLGPNPGAGWTALDTGMDGAFGSMYTEYLPGTPTLSPTAPLSVNGDWVAMLGFFGAKAAAAPTIVQKAVITSGSTPAGTFSRVFTNPVTAGNAILITYAAHITRSNLATLTGSDTQGNAYGLVGIVTSGNTDGQATYGAVLASNVAAGTTTVSATFTYFGSLNNSLTIAIYEIAGLAAPVATKSQSQILQATNFKFSIPSTVFVLGFQAEISGHQSIADANAVLKVSVINPTASSPTFVQQLPLVDGTIFVGTPTTNWGLALTPALLNNPNFGINIVATNPDGSLTIFDIYAVKLKVWTTPNPPPSFNYLKTFAETGGEVLNMVLGSDGIFYQEDAINTPGVLTSVLTGIQPNSFAQSATVDDREFIAISNLQNGTDVPRTYTPPNFDRLSQVGPGAPPTVASSSASNSIVSITQPTVKSDPIEPGRLSGILWSAGPGSTAVGNTLTVYYAGTNHLAVADPDLVIGAGVQLAAINPAQFAGQTVNGDYIITSTGQGVPPGAAQSRWYFTVTMPSAQSINQANHIEANAPSGTYQVTTATLTAAAQVPNLEVGGTLQIAGTGGAPTAGYDGSFTVNATPNASQLQITSTVLNGNVATFGFNLITGTNPVVGQIITVTGTLNGNGIFNVQNQAISATSPGTFSITLFGSNVSSAPESGSGIIFGTIFKFDPLVIVGNRTGGNLVTTGVISAGVRKACYSFLTRNGFMTQPSPIATFDVTAGAASLQVSNLLTGPSNVIARVIHLTAANGGNFYNIPEPVPVNNNGTIVTSTSTWVNDNTSTSVTLSFSDGVLLAADEIDIEGNNLFENIELGSCVAVIPYDQRLFAVGEQNKIPNLLNYSFDGGIGGGAGSTASVPAGWTVDPTNGAGGSVVSSPIFGFAYQILNQSGVTQAIYGMITQPAFQDEFLVPIINASLTYSVRATVSVPTGAAGGNLVIDLFSPSFNKIFGSFTLPLTSVGTTMGIFTGTLLTVGLAPVPSDLVIRIYATAIPNNVQVNLDRIEPFPTETPNLNVQVIASYTEAFEQFDRLTGVVKANQQNQQPVVTGFVLSGALYLVKTGSIVAIVSNDTTEPAFWNKPRTISQTVGAFGPYAVTLAIDTKNSGEEWAIIANLAGAFLFQGSQPIKLSEEIQQLWNMINAAFGYTVWVQNDIINRRILFGVPLKALKADGTVPTWFPPGLFTDNNPSTPNAIIALNYKQLNTAAALANDVLIHRSYSGKLVASDIVRKWSIWTVKAPCAAFLQRADTSTPLFLGNSDNNGKVFDLIEGLLSDDGNPVNQIYATAGFMPTEAAEGMQLGVTRFTFEYGTMVITGAGSVTITVFPNTLDTPYSHTLLPNLSLPASTNGDAEFPLNESGSRLFIIFGSNAVGSGYQISRLVVMMTKDPWSPVRGVNN